MDEWPVRLVCPRDHAALEPDRGELVCARGHRFPLADGIPVLLLEDERPTHGSCTGSAGVSAAPESEHEPDGGIDPFVQQAVAATCGVLYSHLVGRLSSYPIPELRLPPGKDELLLDIGCSWGRWCVAAARRGYRPVGIDPSLEAIQAARRVARRLGVRAHYLVADARHLPFPASSFAVVFSYSVFQHFAKEDALASFDEIGRALLPRGTSMIQMANLYGARSLYHQLRERRFREPRRLFDIRYWSPNELRDELARRIGPTSLAVDGFFTLNAQPSDLHLLPRRRRAVVRASEALRRASGRVAPLQYVADSLYAVSRRPSD